MPMENHLQAPELIVLLQTHGFDLMAQAEASARGVRDIQYHIAALKAPCDETARADALHAIRQNASMLLLENDGFCVTLREVQALAARLSPERRHTHQFVMWDRRRRAI
jgi:hypothetical protein